MRGKNEIGISDNERKPALSEKSITQKRTNLKNTKHINALLIELLNIYKKQPTKSIYTKIRTKFALSNIQEKSQRSEKHTPHDRISPYMCCRLI